MQKFSFWKRGLALIGFSLAMLVSTGAQNIVEVSEEDAAAPPVQATGEQVGYVLNHILVHGKPPQGAAQRIQGKLEAHVLELLDGWPWMPFQHTLGISGYQTYFNHPDEMFYALALALPYLSPAAADRTKAFLKTQLAESPPYASEGWRSHKGRPRESYHVPANLRLDKPSIATSAFGVYAFWAWCHAAQDTAAAQSHWSTIHTRMKPLLEADYRFDTRKQDYAKNESEKLNGDLAGLIGLFRLARLNSDPETARLASNRVAQLLELRLNLERVNPKILEKTAASKSLHLSKPTRYCALVPEVGEAVRRWTDSCGAKRLRAFREQRNSWFMAYGDRLVGGENYTNPMDLSRSLFAGASLIEGLPAENLVTFIDVPWCRGDFYFVEKCALGLWAASGRNWTSLEPPASSK